MLPHSRTPQDQPPATPLERARTTGLSPRKPPRQPEQLDAALELLRPLLKSGCEQQGACYFRALSKLHRHYPELNQGELEALALAVLRTLHGR